MTAALLGLGSGALHAVSGPDHLVSLAPLSLARARPGWRVGFEWGIGHALGTVLAAVALFTVASAAHLPAIERWGERAAGAALVGMGGAGLLSLRRRRRAAAATPSRRAVAVGLVHGVTGAAGLLLFLPVLQAAGAERALYLVGFSLGSTAAMAALTGALARAGTWRPLEAFVRHAPLAGAVAALIAGAVWIATA